jgi:2-polyprenyl-3-methyl-5-hydroxy-6-metoxy-1,4-benzoquinol methylase
MFDELWDNIFYCAPGFWTLWRCRSCESGYLSPRPNEATITLAYANYYTHERSVQPKVDLNLVSRIRRSLANGYRNFRYQAGLADASRIGAALAIFPRLKQAMDIPLRYLPRRTSDRDYRVLDVGCGGGDFLDAAASIGWVVAGCDPDPAVAASSREGFSAREVRVGGIEAWTDSASTFDAITFSHVIEHVHNPVAAIKLAFDLLAPGGMIYLETPNIDALGRLTYGRNWRGLEPPRHLVLFNWAGLERIVSQAGFTRIRRLPRTGMFKGMARQSIRMSRGLNPFDPAAATDEQPDKLRRFKAGFARSRSEFVTLVAYKSAIDE